MHPASIFGWKDEASLIPFLAEQAFAQITVCSDHGPMAVHAPLLPVDPQRFQFHVSRANRACPALNECIRHQGTALATVVGPHGYVSPDWYAHSSGQVPTWNYALVEIEGRLRSLSPAEMHDLLTALSATHEAKLAPKPAWTLEKLDLTTYRALMGGIVGYELSATRIVGTRKASQNKTSADRKGVKAALDALGRQDLAIWIDE